MTSDNNIGKIDNSNFELKIVSFRPGKYFMLLWIIGTLVLGSGCSALLPSARQYTESPWKSFEEAKIGFDKIIPGKTTRKDLEKLGYDPFKTPNIRILTHLDILQKFLPNQSIKEEDLDPAVQSCLKAKNNCSGYEISPEKINNKRHGNLFLDLLNFKRQVRISGWRFDALIIIKDDLVVYKLDSGNPMILKEEEKKNPLGPLQDIRIITPSINLENL